MNKKVKFLVAMMAVAGISTPALAIEADIKGFYQARAVAHDNIKTNEKTASGVDQRFRLWTTGAVNENVKAVFGIEIDNAWGTSGTTKGGDTGTADQVGNIEVKHTYLDFTVPSIETRFVAGLQGFSIGRAFIFDEDATGLKIYKDAPWGGQVAFNWIKQVEGDAALQSDDVDFYSIQTDLRTDLGGAELAIVPVYGYYNEANGDDAHYYGVSVDGTVANLGVALSLIGNSWEEDGGNDGSGMVAFAKVSMPMGATTISAEAAYMGDEDNGGEFKSVRDAAFINYSEVLQGGKFDARGSNIGTSVEGQSNLNHVYFKLAASHKYNDKNTISAAYIYDEQAEDTAAGDAITFGHEIDAYYTYSIDKGLSLTVGGGYLIADDEFMDEDPWKVGSALTYKF